MRSTLIISYVTFHEVWRRKVLFAAFLLGFLFLLLFGIGFVFIVHANESGARVMQALSFSTFALAGLYIVHFLAIVLTIVMTIDTISGEIASHTIQTIAIKPVRRWQIILGKWIGYSIMLGCYTLLLGGGVLLETLLVSGYVPGNIGMGAFLLFLESEILLSLSLLCGTYLSTLTSGVVLFMLFGIAFIGSWVEQIGSVLHAHATEQIGTITSLLLPVEAIWRLISYDMQPPLMRNLNFSPFSLGMPPSNAIIWYALFYILALLLLAMRHFSRRDL